MSGSKIKISQYLVRGKRRVFRVLKFSALEHAWAYFDYDGGRYEIDGDMEAFRWLKYAMAALAVSPDRIVYFPIRKKHTALCYAPNYDAVLTRPELQLRRSEWVDLRRQLDPAHRVGNYQLHYDEDKLCAALDGFEGSSRYYRAVKKLGQEVSTVLGDTVFLTLLRENCLLCHRNIVNYVEPRDDKYGLPICGLTDYILGWYLPENAVRLTLDDRA